MPSKSPLPARWLAALPLAIVLLFTRTADVKARPLWYDEAGQVWISGAPTMAEMHTRALLWDRHPPGYSWLLRPFALIDAGEVLLRSVSVAAGILSVVFTWGMARAWLPRWEAGCVVLLVGASSSVALYAHEARPYALGLLALIIFFWMLARHWNSPSWKTTLGLALTSAATILFLYASVVVVGTALTAALACHLIIGRDIRGRVTGLWLSLLALALVGGWLQTAYLQHYGNVSAVSQAYLADLPRAGSLAAKAWSLVVSTMNLLGYLAIGHAFGPRWEGAGMICGITMGLLACVGTVVMWRRGGGARILAVSLTASVTAFMALACMSLHPYGGGRHCLVIAPSMIMAVAAGLGTLNTLLPHLARSVIAALVFLGIASSLRSTTPNYMVEDLPSVLREIKNRRQPDDSLWVAQPGALAFEYYRKRCNVDDLPVRILAPHRALDQEEIRSTTNANVTRHWLILTHCKPEEARALEDAFASACHRVDQVTFHGASASCWR